MPRRRGDRPSGPPSAPIQLVTRQRGHHGRLRQVPPLSGTVLGIQPRLPPSCAVHCMAYKHCSSPELTASNTCYVCCLVSLGFCHSYSKCPFLLISTSLDWKNEYSSTMNLLTTDGASCQKNILLTIFIFDANTCYVCCSVFLGFCHSILSVLYC